MTCRGNIEITLQVCLQVAILFFISSGLLRTKKIEGRSTQLTFKKNSLVVTYQYYAQHQIHDFRNIERKHYYCKQQSGNKLTIGPTKSLATKQSIVA
jgi:hypothetical protein